MNAEHQNPGPRFTLQLPPHAFDAAYVGRRNVHHDHVRAEPAENTVGFRA